MRALNAVAQGVRCVVHSIALQWMAFAHQNLFALAGVLTSGGAINHHAGAFPYRVQRGNGRVWCGVGGHGVELVLHPSSSPPSRRCSRPRCIGIAIAWLLQARTEFRGRARLSLRRCWFCHPRHGAGRELHPGVQRATVRADGHGPHPSCLLHVPPICRWVGRARRRSSNWTVPREASVMLRRTACRTFAMWCCPLPALVAALVYSFDARHHHREAVIFWSRREAGHHHRWPVGNGDHGVALAYRTVLIISCRPPSA